MAQNLKTEPAKIDIEKLEQLSAQELALVEAIAAGKNNCEAYRAAYGAEGYSPPALRVRACRKIAERKIQDHLAALQAVGLANAKLTKEARIESMLSAAVRAEIAGNFGAAATFHKEANELLGYKVQLTADVTEHNPERTLREIAQHNPELAESLARQNNIPWNSKDTDEARTRH